MSQKAWIARTAGPGWGRPFPRGRRGGRAGDVARPAPRSARGVGRGARSPAGGPSFPPARARGYGRRRKMSGLAETRCTACRGDEPTLTATEIGELSPQVPGWWIEERDGVERLECAFRFGDFAGALAFTGRVGERAEQAGHHLARGITWRSSPSGAGCRLLGGGTTSAGCTETTSSWPRGRTSSTGLLRTKRRREGRWRRYLTGRPPPPRYGRR